MPLDFAVLLYLLMYYKTSCVKLLPKFSHQTYFLIFIVTFASQESLNCALSKINFSIILLIFQKRPGFQETGLFQYAAACSDMEADL